MEHRGDIFDIYEILNLGKNKQNTLLNEFLIKPLKPFNRFFYDAKKKKQKEDKRKEN